MNRIIAENINPKGKGWAWVKKTGTPINFTWSEDCKALLRWCFTQAFWSESAPAGWYTMDKPPLVKEVYAALCMDWAERRIGDQQFTYHVRNLVADKLMEKRHGTGEPTSAVSRP